MQVFLGMILGALLLVVGVYGYDSMQTSTVARWPGGAGQSHHRELGRRGHRLARAEDARP